MGNSATAVSFLRDNGKSVSLRTANGEQQLVEILREHGIDVPNSVNDKAGQKAVMIEHEGAVTFATPAAAAKMQSSEDLMIIIKQTVIAQQLGAFISSNHVSDPNKLRRGQVVRVIADAYGYIIHLRPEDEEIVYQVSLSYLLQPNIVIALAGCQDIADKTLKEC